MGRASPVAAPVHRPRFDRVLGVVTDTPHWSGPGGISAYEPYVREMRVWASLFDSVQVCAPAGQTSMSGHQAPYSVPNVRWRPLSYTLADGVRGRGRRLAQLPKMVLALGRVVRDADILLLRSPSHSTLVARLLAARLGVPTITKWAGLFDSFPGERLPSRLERHLVRRGPEPALIYGPAERPHLVPFIPALMSGSELARAAELAAEREWERPWRIVSVGRLAPVKGFDLAIRGLSELRRIAPELSWRYTLVGDGPAAGELRDLARDGGIADRVDFPGAVSFRSVQEHYGRAHVVIMPGVKESWSKIVVEAWAHGAVAVAASAGIMPWVMRDENAGRLFDPRPEDLAHVLVELLEDEVGMRALAQRGPELASSLSIESFGSRLEKVLTTHCDLA